MLVTTVHRLSGVFLPHATLYSQLGTEVTGNARPRSGDRRSGCSIKRFGILLRLASTTSFVIPQNRVDFRKIQDALLHPNVLYSCIQKCSDGRLGVLLLAPFGKVTIK